MPSYVFSAHGTIYVLANSLEDAEKKIDEWFEKAFNDGVDCSIDVTHTRIEEADIEGENKKV